MGAEQVNSLAFHASLDNIRASAQQKKRVILTLMSEIDRLYCQMDHVVFLGTFDQNSDRILLPDELNPRLKLCFP